MTKVLFSADLHGNTSQYQKLVSCAIEKGADSVIIGGDIAPKAFSEEEDYIQGQREFLENGLVKLLSPLKEQRRDIRVFLMMGNDDCKANMDVLRKHDPSLFHVIHNKRLKLSGEFEIVGYSIVPITPFRIKDWEKYDLSRVPARFERRYSAQKSTEYLLKGSRSTRQGWKDYAFKPSAEKRSSIQRDLESELFTQNPSRTVYVFHAPPHDTCLDKHNVFIEGFGWVSVSIGSFAVREFIERHQPYATLHGHAHMSANITGRYKQRIGETISISAGNNNTPSTLSLIEFHLENPWMARRHII
ncbi:metallophosphoesterase [Candidatus Woesearchaeota archaeon]|nr:metallophosphoesterase [Candidatus Woesearchaeota archaeon]